MSKVKPKRQFRKDEDNAWKELLDRHFAGFLKFFFPAIHAAIDWTRRPVFLDKELPKLGPRHLRGHRLADKLAKVWLKNGQPLYLILHAEIQGQTEADFNQRMYIYHYRIEDRFNCPVVSLAVITGSPGRGAVGRYATEWWGCRSVFEFPVVKLSDWHGREAELLASADPFALVVLAQLKALGAKSDAQRKYAVKRELALWLLERGYGDEYTQSLLRFLDWLIRLPEAAEQKLKREVKEITGGKAMPYVTSWEQMAEKRGVRKGECKVILHILQSKLGALDEKLSQRIEKLSAKRLEQLAEALLDFSQPDDLERWLKRKAG